MLASARPLACRRSCAAGLRLALSESKCRLPDRTRRGVQLTDETLAESLLFAVQGVINPERLAHMARGASARRPDAAADLARVILAGPTPQINRLSPQGGISVV